MCKFFWFITLGVVILSPVGCTYTSWQDQIKIEVANQRAQSLEIAKIGLQSIQELPPLPKNWQEMVKEEISFHLKDPDSAKYTFREDPKYCSFSNTNDHFGRELRDNTMPLIGYAGLVFVNAKNSYGGYTGNKPWFFMISNGKLSLLDVNPYGVWQTLYDVQSHLEISYAQCLLIKK